MTEPGNTTKDEITEHDWEAPASTLALLEKRGRNRGPELRARLTAYIRLLLARNREYNLTADRHPQLQWTRHVDDALTTATLIEERIAKPGAGDRLLDVGSGGGVPGLIYAAIWPQAAVTLLDATGKKTRFLAEAAEAMGLKNVTVVNARAEDAGHLPEHRDQYRFVVCRALADLQVLAEWTVPFCKWSGFVIAIKGDNVRDEIRASQRAFKVLAVPMGPKIFPYRLSTGKDCTLLVFKKIGMTPSTYPRRTGIAQKKPM